LTVYIDTSILAAYYCPEALSESVQRFLAEQTKPAISSLTEVELFSSVARKVRMHELNQVDGSRILSKFLSHLNANLFTFISIETRHWQFAKNCISLFSTPLRTLDALHLAVASLEDAEMVSSDKYLIQAAKVLGVTIRTIN
jgi:uncharacterized protein